MICHKKELIIKLTIIAIYCVSSTFCDVSNSTYGGAASGVGELSNRTTLSASFSATAYHHDNIHQSKNFNAPSLKSSTISSSKSSSAIPPNTNTATTEEDDYDYYTEKYGQDGETRRIRDNTKIAQIVVYFSLVFIALAGVLIKYFINEFETSQMKAQEQLNYQRLHSQKV